MCLFYYTTFSGVHQTKEKGNKMKKIIMFVLGEFVAPLILLNIVMSPFTASMIYLLNS